jgi:hypothetical protein
VTPSRRGSWSRELPESAARNASAGRASAVRNAHISCCHGPAQPVTAPRTYRYACTRLRTETTPATAEVVSCLFTKSLMLTSSLARRGPS